MPRGWRLPRGPIRHPGRRAAAHGHLRADGAGPVAPRESARSCPRPRARVHAPAGCPPHHTAGSLHDRHRSLGRVPGAPGTRAPARPHRSWVRPAQSQGDHSGGNPADQTRHRRPDLSPRRGTVHPRSRRLGYARHRRLCGPDAGPRTGGDRGRRRGRRVPTSGRRPVSGRVRAGSRLLRWRDLRLRADRVWRWRAGLRRPIRRHREPDGRLERSRRVCDATAFDLRAAPGHLPSRRRDGGRRRPGRLRRTRHGERAAQHPDRGDGVAGHRRVPGPGPHLRPRLRHARRSGRTGSQSHDSGDGTRFADLDGDGCAFAGTFSTSSAAAAGSCLDVTGADFALAASAPGSASFLTDFVATLRAPFRLSAASAATGALCATPPPTPIGGGTATRCNVPTGCGDGMVGAGEQCDGASDASCPGGCRGDCRCATCMNDVAEPGEACDWADDDACPGRCQADCTCGPAAP